MKPLLIRAKILPFESLSSLVYRLTQANFYDRTGRIYGLVVSPQKFASQNLLSDRNSIKNLSILNKCSEDEIISATVHRFAKFFSGKYSHMMDSNVQENYVLRSKTKYCPFCVSESDYHKIHWDLVPVTACLKHKVILQDACPKCGHPIAINWVLRNKCECECRCGSALLSINPVSLSSSPNAIRNQFFIQRLLGINELEDLSAVSLNHNSPSLKLSSPDFFRLLKIFMIVLSKLPKSSDFLKFGSITAEHPNWITTKNKLSGLKNFVLTHSAASILLDWPQKFYEFLKEYSKIDRSERRDIGGLNELLLDKLDPKKFGFMYHAYCNYLNGQWKGGHLSANIKYLNIPEKTQKKCISVDEAAKILGIGENHVSSLINQKIIQAIVCEIKIRKRYLIDAESVYALKSRVDRMLKPLDLEKRLDISDKMIKSLVKSGLLIPFKIRPWSPKYSYHFEPEEVERFERKFLSEERYPLVDKKPEGYLSITEAVKIISDTGTSAAKLLQLVREDVFNPILCREEKGLSRLFFSEDEIRKYRDEDAEKKRDGNRLSVYQASIIIGKDMRIVQHLIKIGLIRATVENVDGKQVTYILKKDLEEFRQEYLFIKEAATLMDFDTETVFQYVKQGYLKDYSDIPITRRTSIRILRREEIKPYMPGNMMTVIQAAEYLGLTTQNVYDLIRKNKLPTLKGEGIGKTPFHRIPTQEVVRYEENFLKSVSELVSTLVSYFKSGYISKSLIRDLLDASERGISEYLRKIKNKKENDVLLLEEFDLKRKNISLPNRAEVSKRLEDLLIRSSQMDIHTVKKSFENVFEIIIK